MNKLQKLIVIVGPTASGKTTLAIKLAQQFNGEVISADSRQVYRGLDIGTEKVASTEMGGITHHLIDVADIHTTYTAADFKHDATAAIRQISSRSKLPIIAGGTFFYIDTLLGTVTLPEVPPDPELRAQLEQMPIEVLVTSLKKIDPDRARTIDTNNKRRLIRALEIVKQLGNVPTHEYSVDRDHSHYRVCWIGMDVPREVLRTRIKARAVRALARGLIEETKALIATGISRERLEEIGLEYALVIEYLDKKIDDEELAQKLEEKNWQYAKRQMTWLRRNENIQWFIPDDPKIRTTIQKFLES